MFAEDPLLFKIARSIRDWGRDCWCPTGKDNTCAKRFMWQLGELPYGYDHKYIYSEIGYNLKMTDFQAALGVAQMGKLDGFVRRRKENFAYLSKVLSDSGDSFILPKATEGSSPSWFGFPLTVRETAPFPRERLTAFLEEAKVATRLLFAGNVARQPYFKHVAHRKVGDLARADQVMRGTFWVGVHPSIDAERVAYMLATFDAFFKAL